MVSITRLINSHKSPILVPILPYQLLQMMLNNLIIFEDRTKPKNKTLNSKLEITMITTRRKKRREII